MTINEAIVILNDYDHRSFHRPEPWYAVKDSTGEVEIRKDYWGVRLSVFEAIAIAEKYQRDATNSHAIGLDCDHT